MLGGASFSAFLDSADAASDVASSEPVSTAAPVLGAGALLGLQEVNEEEVARRKAVKKGRTAIEALEQLRDSLLTGTLSPNTIRQLEQIVNEQRVGHNDSRLHHILDEIEVRAAVELAKLERAGLVPTRSL